MPAELGPLEVAWVTAELDRVRDLLLGLGLPPRSDGSLSAGPVVVTVRSDRTSPADRLIIEGPLEPSAEDEAAPAGGPAVLALGWATVDAERFADELGRSLSTEVYDEPDLGARARLLSADVSRTAGAPTLRLITLEPSTEGRLAGALARHGEGPVAIYLDGVGGAPDVADASPPHPTPLGRPGRLLRPAQVSGPYLIVTGSE